VAGLTGQAMRYEYRDQHREGDHICYISDLRKMTTDYPSWGITKSLDVTLEEMVTAWRGRLHG
jgi:CDP-paratose 2-epimerase